MVPFSSPHPTVPSHSHWVNSSEHRWVSFGERQRLAPNKQLLHHRIGKLKNAKLSQTNCGSNLCVGQRRINEDWRVCS